MGKLNILVVDDNRDFCDSLKDILENQGYEALVAYDGETAVALARKERFDLILMDLVMPGMDGVEAIKEIRNMMPGVPVIVITAFGEETIVEEAKHAGIDGKFGKPLDFVELINLVRTYCPA